MKYRPFYKKQSRAIRLWHWSMLIITALSFYTVFTGKFFLNPFNTSTIIHNTLQQHQFHNNPDPSSSIAEALSENVWDWHIRYGYALIVLFFFRLWIAVYPKRNQQFFSLISSAFTLVRKKEYRKAAIHYLMVQLVYSLFYINLLAIISTGLWLSFQRQPSNVQLAHSIKEIHQSCFYFLFLFILFHIAGVFLAERKNYKNIVSNMINGGKELE